MRTEKTILFIKTTDKGIGEKSCGVDDSVIIDTTQYSDAQIQYIHSICDCYVSCSYGEGIGLPVLDAQLHKKPIICSGGLTGCEKEYLNLSSNVMFVASDNVVGMNTNNINYLHDSRVHFHSTIDTNKLKQYIIEMSNSSGKRTHV